jgi:hypothetical protein
MILPVLLAVSKNEEKKICSPSYGKLDHGAPVYAFRGDVKKSSIFAVLAIFPTLGHGQYSPPDWS